MQENLHQQSGKPGLSGAVLKLTAMAVMLVDHAAAGFLELSGSADGVPWMEQLPHGELLDLILRGIGRSAFPIFCFFLVEGFYHTRSRWKYLRNLTVAGLVSQIPFYGLLFTGRIRDSYGGAGLQTDVFFTLALGLIAVWITDVSVKRRWVDGSFAALSAGEKILRLSAAAGGIAGCCAAAVLLNTYYSCGGVLAILLLYLFYHRRKEGLALSYAELGMYSGMEFLAIPGFALLLCYNGERGRQNKFLFYSFYPVHLFVLWVIRLAVFGY